MPHGRGCRLTILDHMCLSLFMLMLVACSRPADHSDTFDTRTPAYAASVINPKLVGGVLDPASKSVLLWGTDGVILRSEDGLTWAQANTPTSADLASIAAGSKHKVLVAVGNNTTVLRSEDGGRNWSPGVVDTTGTDLQTVIHHASSDRWLAAGTHGTLLSSLDDGRTWTAQKSGLDITFQTLFVEATTQAILVGGDEGVLGRSTDGGANWNIARIAMSDPVTPITGFRQHGATLLALSALGRMLVSHDAGLNWALVALPTNAFFTDSAFDPEHRALVMTSHIGDVFQSVDDGETWTQREIKLDGDKRYLSAVRYDNRSASLIAVGHHGALVSSVDGGATWNKMDSTVQTSLESVVQDPGRGLFVAFGEGGFILTSTDHGKRWKQISPSLAEYLREVVAMPNGQVVVGSGGLGTVLRSDDAAKTWREIAVDYPDQNTPPNLRSLVIAPHDGALIAAGAPGTVIRSADAGIRWTLEHWTPLTAEEAFPSIVVDHKRNVIVVLEARGRHVVSRDGGLNWSPSVVLSQPREIWHGSVMEQDGVMFAAGQGGVIVRSEDSGKSWSLVESAHTEDLYGTYADERSNTFYALGEKGTLLRSADNGKTWKAAASGTPQPLRRMLTDPRTGALIAFGGKGVIVRSQDAGLTWATVNEGSEAELRSGLIEPGSRNLIVIGQRGTILRSTDSGKTWQPLASHTTRHFRSATFNPRNGDLIVVGERIVRLERLAPAS